MITGKNIVITGCNNGIGLEILKLLKNSNSILCVDTGTENLKSLSSGNITVFQKDVSSKEAVDEIFSKAEELFGTIDIFFANAGFGYYEEIDYVSWDRVERIFQTNVFSPIYSYQKYLKHIGDKEGIFVLTGSVIGLIAIPGFAMYSSTKFALDGFSRAIRFEKPDNLQFTCIYPVATDTEFFKRANKIDYKKPFPVQSPETVAKKAVKGVEKGKKNINTSIMFNLMKPAMRTIPPLKTLYLLSENRKFRQFRIKVNELKNTHQY